MKQIQTTQDVQENKIRLHKEAEAVKRREHKVALEKMRTDKLRLEIKLAELGGAVRPEKVDDENTMIIHIVWMTICKGLRDF